MPNVGGARRDWSNVIVDGVVANEVGASNLMAQQINLDAIAEVRVLLNSYRAEYGRAGGGQVQIVSKSGTSNYHGNLYYYGRHENLNATNFFTNRANAEKPRYRFNTYGANLGGPVPKAEKKLFFFYSIEAPLVSRPGPLRNWTMPTDREMQGDFSQTLDGQGRLINIKDPLREGACNAVDGGPGCFPGNIIPANRINASGRALLNMLPRANNFDRTFTQGQFNYSTQENADNPKMNNVVRVDWRPTANDSLYFTFKDWYSDQRGSEITAGPNKWGFFNTHYLNTDRGVSVNYAKVITSNLVLDADFGIRQQTEQFYPLTEGDWERINRDNVGFTVGQFHPELNPRNVIPKVNFNVPNTPNFTFDNRLVDQGRGLADVDSHEPDVDQGQPLDQGRVLLRAVAELGGQRRRRRRPVGRRVHVQHRHQQPLRHQLQLRQRPPRHVPRVPRDRRVLRGQGQALHLGVLPPGHVEGEPAADARLRPALPLVHAVVFGRSRRRSSSPSATTRQGAAALRAGARQQRQRRLRSGHRPDPPERLRRHVRAGHRRSLQRHGEQPSPNYPKGFRDNQGIEPEPRLGLAWDLTGDSKTALHASVGLYHNPHVNANGLDAMARNPPAQNTPSIIYGTMDTLLAAGSQGAFSNRPSDVFGVQRDAQTPKSYNYSIGVQREVGWGTVLDVTYAGFQMRDAEMNSQHQHRAGRRALRRRQPAECQPAEPDDRKAERVPAAVLGYQNITMREHFGAASYNALQVQLNRRYINGLQFAVAYTFGKTISDGTTYNTLARRGVERGPDGATQ